VDFPALVCVFLDVCAKWAGPSGRHQIFMDVPGEAAKQSLHIQYSVVTRGKCSKLPIRHSNKPKPNEQQPNNGQVPVPVYIFICIYTYIHPDIPALSVSGQGPKPV